jgi:hypothetical protein
MISVIFDDFPSVPKGNSAWIALGCITDFSATVIVINYQRPTTSQNSMRFVDDVPQILGVMPNYN